MDIKMVDIFNKKTEESCKEIEKVKGVKMSVKEFLREMESW